jgi:hypothetical protein
MNTRITRNVDDIVRGLYGLSSEFPVLDDSCCD